MQHNTQKEADCTLNKRSKIRSESNRLKKNAALLLMEIATRESNRESH